MENDTVFGKIIKGEIPCTKVYEDEQFLAFLDIHPVSKGHTILIPKKRFAWIQDVPDDLLSESFIKAKTIILAMKSAISCDYIKVLVEGVQVAHFHIHLIPSFREKQNATWDHVVYSEGETDYFAEKIKSELK